MALNGVVGCAPYSVSQTASAPEKVKDSYFRGPSGQDEFEQVVKAVVREQFESVGQSTDSQAYYRRVRFIQEMASHESTGWKPLIHSEYVKGKNGVAGYWQTVRGWFQMRTDTFEALRDRRLAWTQARGLGLPSFFHKCGESDQKKGTGVYSLQCQAWIVNWEMAMSDPLKDPRGKQSQLKQWGPVQRKQVKWALAKQEADLEYELLHAHTTPVAVNP